jgi:uncharacterized RDD family membrane protein YckC
MIDTRLEVATPEGCTLALRLAGPLVRSRAWLLDCGVRLLIVLVLQLVLGYLRAFGIWLLFLTVFGLEWLYPILFEVLWHGSTPGKRMCQLIVVNDDATPIRWNASIIRNTLRAVDFLPSLYGVGLISLLLGSQFKRLGDYAAGTVVVYRDWPDTAVAADPTIASVVPAVELTIEEQRAVIEFARRAPMLTPERAGELASLATPLVNGMTAEQARQRIMGVGNYLLGQR